MLQVLVDITLAFSDLVDSPLSQFPFDERRCP